MTQKSVLLVDDEEEIRGALAGALAEAGHRVEQASRVEDAESLFCEHRFDVVVTDLRLADGCGLDLLNRLRAVDARFAAIITTGLGTYEQALEAIRLRVFAFLAKPFSTADLLRAVESCAPHENRAQGGGTTYRAPARPADVERVCQQIEAELARAQAQPWVAARALELLCEALENAVAHAYPGREGAVGVDVERDGASLILNISDDGCGFDVAHAIAGALDCAGDVRCADAPGIIKFHRDADEVRIDSKPGSGTRVRLRFRNAFEDYEHSAQSLDDVALACLWS